MASQMDDDWRKDQARQGEINKLRHEISDFLEKAKSWHLYPGTMAALEECKEALKRESDHISRIWD